MFLVFDTETTGLPKNFKAPLTDFDNWPRLVQLAWQIHDEKGELIEVKNYIVKPEGFEIPFQAEKVHGISTERAHKDGKELTWVLEEFNKSLQKTNYLIGHNVEFDINILGCEYLRKAIASPLLDIEAVDTKDESTEYCALPGGRGGKFKWPNLSELHNKLFGEGFDEAHNASADVVATARCFLELVRLGVISTQRLQQTPDFFVNFTDNNPDVIQPVDIEIDSNFTETAATKEVSIEEELSKIEEEAVDIVGEKHFTHLHVHSQYSILDGAAPISALVSKAKNDGMKALALTDHGNMFGIKEFHEACKGAGIKPILGVEAYLVDDLTIKDKTNYHIVLLAKNETGYKNLLKLVSIANIKGMYYKPRIDKAALETHSEGLIVSTACLGGEVNRTLMNEGVEAAEQKILWYKNIFKDDFYLELQRHPTNDPRLKSEIFENQKYVNAELIKFGEKHNIKVIATNDVHFMNEEDAAAHDLLICLNTGKDVDDPNRMRYTQQEWFKTTEEMYALWADNPHVLQNTMEIVEKVEEFELDSNPIMPEFPIPEEFGTMESYKEKFPEDKLKEEFERYDQLGGYLPVLRIKLESDYLEHLTYIGSKNRYGDEGFDGAVKERVDFELNTIKQMGFPGYFLIVQDFISAARDMGVLVGPGRGSAAGAVVAYALRITNIDPIAYNLLFERFLNPDRISMPDIDIDFDDDGRQMVLDWVTEKYGQDKVAHICTFGTMAAKMAMKDVARVLKLPLDEANRLTKEFPENGKLARAFKVITDLEKQTGSLEKATDKIRQERNRAIKQDDGKEALKRDVQIFVAEEMANARASNNQTELDTLDFACTLEGSVRQTGVHACGILIGKNPLDEHIPLMPTKEEELFTTQYDGRYVESIGLLKMDFLGLKTLSIIKEALANIKLSRGLDIDVENISFEDKNTFDLFSRGETTAIFQFESPGMKKHLRSLQPNRFEDLVAMNALYRPGPMEYIPDFIERKHGRKEVKYDHPLMEQYLEESYGITVFQEQVMLLSRVLGNFTRGQSDTLRKAMGKKKLKLMNELKVLFVEGCLKNEAFIKGCEVEKKDSKELIEKIWKDWVAFASYAFNKSHSVCYAYVAYQTGYLKAHFPAEFMAATLSRNLSNISEVTKLMEECRRMGTNVLVPDVNESFARFTVNPDGDIRFGMAAIKGVGESAVDHIIEDREKNGLYKTVYEFVERVNLSTVNKKSIENMVMAGCFDSFKDIQRHQFFETDNEGLTFIDQLVRYGNLIKNQEGATTLFGNDSSYQSAQKAPDIPLGEPWPPLEKLNKEKELIGIYLSSHPLDDFKLEIDNFAKHKLSELNDLNRLYNKQVCVAGLVTEVKHLMTKTGRPFGALTVEDYSDSYRFMLFGKDYEEYRNYLYEGYSLLLKGTVQENPWKKDVRELEFKIKAINLLANVREELVKNLSLKMEASEITEDIVEKIHDQASQSKGKAHLSFQIYDSTEGMKIEMFSRNTMVDVSNEFLEFLDKNSIKYAVS